jgi:multiple sugar transport system ATP-binding protein
MRRGVLQQVGAPMELYDQPVNLFVAGFIGSPAMNFLRRHAGGRRSVAFPLGLPDPPPPPPPCGWNTADPRRATRVR